MEIRSISNSIGCKPRQQKTTFGTSQIQLLQRNMPEYYEEIKESSGEWLKSTFKYVIATLKKNGNLAKFQDTIVDYYERLFGEVKTKKPSSVKKLLNQAEPQKIDLIEREVSDSAKLPHFLSGVSFSQKPIRGTNCDITKFSFNEGTPEKASVNIKVPHSYQEDTHNYTTGDTIINILAKDEQGKLHSMAHDVSKASCPEGLEKKYRPDSDIPGFKIGKYEENGFLTMGNLIEAFNETYSKKTKTDIYWQNVGEFLTKVPSWLGLK